MSRGNAHIDEPAPGAAPALKLKAACALGAVALCFPALLFQLARLQIVQSDRFRALARRQQVLSREIPARRGTIYDRKGRELAITRQRWSVFADPQAVRDPAPAAARLGAALGLSPRDLLARLRRDRYFVWIKRQVSDEEAARVRRLELPGVYLRRENSRRYPQGSLAGQVIGFTDIDGRGLAGIERQMDLLLRGRPGMETVLCDGRRRIIRSPQDRLERAAFNGFDVYLTLDHYVQSVAEQELAAAAEKHEPECGTAVVMDVRDGSVLAMASWPALEPQAPAEVPPERQRNIAVSDAYEFGSVFKPVSVGLALQAGAVTGASEFDCHGGEWRLGRRTVHDVHPYGVMSVSDIVCRSSNIGAAQVAVALGAELLHEGLRDFGFGRPTGIALPGEVGGIVRPLRAWTDYSVVSIAFGQEIAVTPLAMARAFAAIANEGKLLQPRIIRKVVRAHDGLVVYAADAPTVTGRPLRPATAAEMTAMMRRVVEEGTGRRARLDEYPVAGKTGTAQLLREDGRGYSEDRYLSSFIAFAPVPQSRIAVLVTLKAPTRNGYYGGTVAAPVVRQIAKRTLRYLDVPPAPPVRVALGDAP